MYPQRSVMTCGLATALEPPHFNHAPVRGATGASFSRRSRAGSFNPRTRVGCDGDSSNAHQRAAWVSIHAPAWGATRLPLPAFCRAKSFNPRTRVGCDQIARRRLHHGHQFQSTHPRGVRHGRLGGDHHLGPVSIHAPAWGATHLASELIFLIERFNPRTRVGCDEGAADTDWTVIQFQSTHPRGVRQDGGLRHLDGFRVSIHAPAWGATRPAHIRLPGSDGFNPRTRVRCDPAT